MVALRRGPGRAHRFVGQFEASAHGRPRNGPHGLDAQFAAGALDAQGDLPGWQIVFSEHIIGSPGEIALKLRPREPVWLRCAASVAPVGVGSNILWVSFWASMTQRAARHEPAATGRSQNGALSNLAGS